MSTLLTSIWFYSSRGTQCCAEIRSIIDLGAGQTCGAPYIPPPDDATGCPPAGPCLGFLGACADVQEQFLSLQGCYVFSDGTDEPTEHDSIADYVCHAFPDDAYVTDQFFVGLISIAVALPVDRFLGRAFEIANEGDEGLAGSWLEAPSGKWKLMLGKDAHNGWRLADPKRPVSDLVLWLVGGGAETDLQAALFIVTLVLRHLRAKIFGVPAPEEPASDAEEEPAAEEEEEPDARADALKKKLYAAAGLIGTYVIWAIFSWYERVRRAAACARRAAPDAARLSPPRLQVHLRLRHAHLCATPPPRLVSSAALTLSRATQTKTWARMRRTRSANRGVSATA